VLHGTPLQHWELVVHVCPYDAQGVPLLEVLDPVLVDPVLVDPVLLVVEPLLELLPPHGPQTPVVLPTGAMQDSPGQQSALVLHLPHAGTQLFW